jgi:TatD DNase family protein
MIDAHAHLNMLPEPQWPAVLERAAMVGVRLVLVPATGPQDLHAVLACVASAPGRLLAALGCHPHEARLLDDAGKRRLERALGEPSVVAVGEIGLDYHYDLSPREDQRRALAWQLALAREAGLPVILHHREAWQDFLAALDTCPGVPGVAHSFTEGAAGVGEMIRRGLLVGISGMVTFPKAENVREAARAVPVGSLLVETDSPYLAPVPHRGAVNEPAWVLLVAEKVAALRGAALGQLEAETDAAFARLFLARGQGDSEAEPGP